MSADKGTNGTASAPKGAPGSMGQDLPAPVLAPCPWCGCEPRFIADDSYGDCMIFCASEDQEPGSCLAAPIIHVEKDRVAESIAAWNRRSDPVRDELVAVCRAIEAHCQVGILRGPLNPAAHADEGRRLRERMQAALAKADAAAPVSPARAAGRTPLVKE